MRISTLLGMAIPFAVLGLVLFLIVLICYFLVYRKLLKGQKKPSLKRILWWAILFCYGFCVLEATLLMRSASLYPDPIHGLFYSYRDAWFHWSLASWRNIILNFCMFVPLGILLPMGFPFFRKGMRVTLTGFGGSLLIELTQLITRRGMFEPDDLLGNTVGAMIGYGVFLLGACLLRVLRREKPFQTKKVLLGQLPLLATFLTFACIFLKYDSLELGISTDSYIVPYDTKHLKVTTELSFSTEKGSKMVYQTKVLTVAEEKTLAKEIYGGMGLQLDEGRIQEYDNLSIFYPEKESFSLWVDHKGGTYVLNNYSAMFPESNEARQPVSGASAEEIMEALELMGIPLPTEMNNQPFEELPNGRYRFTFESVQAEDGILDGIFSCQYYGEGQIGVISSEILHCTPKKEYPLLSEQEAFEELKKGNFFYPSEADLEIRVTSCALVYAVDSKGFLQPSYEFSGTINGVEGYVRIPALRGR